MLRSVGECLHCLSFLWAYLLFGVAVMLIMAVILICFFIMLVTEVIYKAV